MEDVFEALETLKEYCSGRSCADCALNRLRNAMMFDCMLTNETPEKWDVTEVGDEDAD